MIRKKLHKNYSYSPENQVHATKFGKGISTCWLNTNMIRNI
jgi:hypothetical protein